VIENQTTMEAVQIPIKVPRVIMEDHEISYQVPAMETRSHTVQRPRVVMETQEVPYQVPRTVMEPVQVQVPQQVTSHVAQPVTAQIPIVQRTIQTTQAPQSCHNASGGRGFLP